MEREDSQDLMAIVKCESLWQEFESCLQVTKLPDDKLKTMTSAIAVLLLFRSAQRPGAVTGATLAEFRRAKHHGDVWVMTVASHKTASHGAAQVTMEEDTHLRVHRCVSSPDGPTRRDDGVARSPRATANQADERAPATTRSHLRRAGPNCNGRKVLATKAATSCSATEVRGLATQMSHSVQTHQKYYEQLKGSKHAAAAHRTIGKLLGEKTPATETGEDEPPRKKRKFSEGETQSIEEWFREFLEKQECPSLPACRDFLDNTSSTHERTARDIRDKVRNIIKHNQKQNVSL